MLVTAGGPGSNFVRRGGARRPGRRAGLRDRARGATAAGATNVALARGGGRAHPPHRRSDRDDVDRLVAERADKLTVAGRPRRTRCRAAAPRRSARSASPTRRPSWRDQLAGGAAARRSRAAVGLGRQLRRLPRRARRRRRRLAGRRGLGEPPARATCGRRCWRWPGVCGRCAAPRRRRRDRLELIDARGHGFGTATDAERRGPRLALHTEGLLLDPTYGAEAFSVALTGCSAGRRDPSCCGTPAGCAGRAHVTGRPSRRPVAMELDEEHDDDVRRPVRRRVRRLPETGPAPELIESGFALENADAAFLHHGLNLADLAHVLDLAAPRHRPGRRTAGAAGALLLDVAAIAAGGLPLRPRVRGALQLAGALLRRPGIGDVAGWLHAGRPRREAARIALRLHLRGAARRARPRGGRRSPRTSSTGPRSTRRRCCRTRPTCSRRSRRRSGTTCSRSPTRRVRDARRLLDELDGIDASPGGAGCVNGTRLLDDRGPIARRARASAGSSRTPATRCGRSTA